MLSEEDRNGLIRDIENGEYDDEYAEYILDHIQDGKIVSDCESLVEAMRNFYLYDDFIEYRIKSFLIDL